MKNGALLKRMNNWITDYEDNEEHDMDLTIELKDEAYELLNKAYRALSK